MWHERDGRGAGMTRNLRRHARVTLLAGFVGVLGASCGVLPAHPAGARATGAQPPIVDPYEAALSFARCMRRHGVPHPAPDHGGNFRLSPADEKRLQRVGRRKVDAAEKACFRFLRPVVSTKPLSARAKRLARAALAKVRACMLRHGYVFGKPVVRDMSRGRAFFGFADVSPATRDAQGTARYRAAQRTCERGLARALDVIIADDRGEIGY
jgi:hypothetical protein